MTESTRSGVLQIRLSAEERAELERQAREERLTLADLIRVRCDLPLARPKGGKAPESLMGRIESLQLEVDEMKHQRDVLRAACLTAVAEIERVADDADASVDPTVPEALHAALDDSHSTGATIAGRCVNCGSPRPGEAQR